MLWRHWLAWTAIALIYCFVYLGSLSSPAIFDDADANHAEAAREMAATGDWTTLHIDGPFYVGIGFCSHLPDKVDSAVLSSVVLEGSAGKVR